MAETQKDLAKLRDQQQALVDMQALQLKKQEAERALNEAKRGRQEEIKRAALAVSQALDDAERITDGVARLFASSALRDEVAARPLVGDELESLFDRKFVADILKRIEAKFQESMAAASADQQREVATMVRAIHFIRHVSRLDVGAYLKILDDRDRVRADLAVVSESARARVRDEQKAVETKDARLRRRCLWGAAASVPAAVVGGLTFPPLVAIAAVAFVVFLYMFTKLTVVRAVRRLGPIARRREEGLQVAVAKAAIESRSRLEVSLASLNKQISESLPEGLGIARDELLAAESRLDELWQTTARFGEVHPEAKPIMLTLLPGGRSWGGHRSVIP